MVLHTWEGITSWQGSHSIPFHRVDIASSVLDHHRPIARAHMHKVEFSRCATIKLIQVGMRKVHRWTQFWHVGVFIHSCLTISTAHITNTIAPSIHVRPSKFIDEYQHLSIWLACFCPMFYGCIQPHQEKPVMPYINMYISLLLPFFTQSAIIALWHL